MTTNAASRARSTITHFISVWNLAILLVLLIVVFSLLKGDTFLTAFTFQSMVNSRSINALISLAVMIPLASNNFDLSVASTLGIAQVLANGLITKQGLPWELAAALCMLLGAFVGLVNGLLVTVARINSFIATLGTGTLLLGLNQWYTGGMQVVGRLPPAFTALSAKVPYIGIPAPIFYVLAVGVVLWIVFRLPAAGTISLHHRRQSPRRRVDGHLRHDLRNPRLRRFRHAGGVCRRRAAGAASGGAEHRGTGTDAAGVYPGRSSARPRYARGAPTCGAPCWQLPSSLLRWRD